MRCEVCGRKIYGKSFKVVIEGAKLTVCGKCAKHGTIIWEEKRPKPIAPRTKAPTRRLPLRTKGEKQSTVVSNSILELIGDFEAKIRQARLNLALSHEDLGRKISEKVSVLKKIETGKMTPDNKLAAKLEHSLKIKLLAPASEEKLPKAKFPKSTSRKLTLGDLITLDKKAEEKQ